MVVDGTQVYYGLSDETEWSTTPWDDDDNIIYLQWGDGGGKGNEVQRNKGIRGEMALTAQIKLMMLFTMKMVPHK